MTHLDSTIVYLNMADIYSVVVEEILIILNYLLQNGYLNAQVRGIRRMMAKFRIIVTRVQHAFAVISMHTIAWKPERRGRVSSRDTQSYRSIGHCLSVPTLPTYVR